MFEFFTISTSIYLERAKVYQFGSRHFNAGETTHADLFDLYNGVHNPILVVRVSSSYPSVRMHVRVQDALHTTLQKARTAKTWMALTTALQKSK
jgi:hypothetical protein